MILSTFIIFASILILHGSEATTRDLIRDNKLLCKLYPEYCSDQTIEVPNLGCDFTTEVALIIQWDKVIKDSADKLQIAKQEKEALKLEALKYKMEASKHKDKATNLEEQLSELKDSNSFLQSVFWVSGCLAIAGFFAYLYRVGAPAVAGQNFGGIGVFQGNGSEATANGNALAPGDGNALAPGDANNAGGHDNAGGRDNTNLQIREVERATVNYITINHNYNQSNPLTNSDEPDPAPESEPE